MVKNHPNRTRLFLYGYMNWCVDVLTCFYDSLKRRLVFAIVWVPLKWSWRSSKTKFVRVLWYSRDLSPSLPTAMPDFRSRSQRRAEAKVTVSAASAGTSYFYGYTGRTLKSINYSLNLKPAPTISTPILESNNSTTSPILQFAAGDVSFSECFVKSGSLPIKDEKVESTQAGIKTAPKKPRNLNSVSLLLSYRSHLFSKRHHRMLPY